MQFSNYTCFDSLLFPLALYKIELTVFENDHIHFFVRSSGSLLIVTTHVFQLSRRVTSGELALWDEASFQKFFRIPVQLQPVLYNPDKN